MNKFTKDLIFSFFPFIVYTIIKPYQPRMAMFIGLGLLLGLIQYYLHEGNLTNLKKLGFIVSAYVVIYRAIIIYHFYGIIINFMDIAFAVFMIKLIINESNVFKWMIDEYYTIDDFPKMSFVFNWLSFVWMIHLLASGIHSTYFGSFSVEWFRAVGFLSSYKIFRILLASSIIVILPMCLKTSKLLKRA